MVDFFKLQYVSENQSSTLYILILRFHHYILFINYNGCIIKDICLEYNGYTSSTPQLACNTKNKYIGFSIIKS